MSTKFQPPTTPRKTPPWCKPGLYGAFPPIIAGWPQYLVAFLAWFDPHWPVQADETASVKLKFDAATTCWSHDEPGPGLSLGGRVEYVGHGQIYDLNLRLLRDGAMIEDHTWENVSMGPDYPWDSGLQVLGDLIQMQVTF